MGNKYFHSPQMSPIKDVVRQLSSIRNTYSNIESSTMAKNSFTCIMKITPSENSDTYKVEVSYHYGKLPTAKLLSPQLKQRDGKYPHHIYGFDSHGHAELCVFHPSSGEWNSDMLMSKSFIPWISTWLNTYEFWLITGQWHYNEIIADKEDATKDDCKK